MVIENIKLDAEIVKKKEEGEKRKEEKKKYIELTKEFNQEAEKVNCPFKIKFEKAYPYLYTIEKRFIFKEEKEYNTIFYYEKNEISDEEIFIFSGGLDYNIFKAIEPILNKIKANFKITLKNGKVPAKYEIIQELTK